MRFVFVFFGVSLLLWCATSANGRYGIALLLLAGPVIGALLFRLLPARYLFITSFGVLLWHGAVFEVFFKQARPPTVFWTVHYFDWNVPENLAQEPVTLASFGFQTASTLAPRMHPESSHVNLVGQYVPTPGAPGTAKIDRMLHRRDRRLLGVFDAEYTRQDVPGAASIKTYFKDHLLLWGLEFDPRPCEVITLRAPDDSMARLNAAAGVRRRGRLPQLIVCELRSAAAPERVSALEQLAAFRGRLAAFGKECPWFSENPLTYLRTFDRWIVSSFASLETTLEVPDEGGLVLQMMRPPYVARILGEASKTTLTAAERDCNQWFVELDDFAARTIKASRARP